MIHGLPTPLTCSTSQPTQCVFSLICQLWVGLQPAAPSGWATSHPGPRTPCMGRGLSFPPTALCTINFVTLHCRIKLCLTLSFKFWQGKKSSKFSLVFLIFMWHSYIINPIHVIAHEVWYSCSFVEVGKLRSHFDYDVKCMPDHAWPFIKENQAEYGTIPGPIRRSARGSLWMGFDVSCIKLFGK